MDTTIRIPFSIHAPHTVNEKATRIRNSAGRVDPDMPDFEAMGDKELWEALVNLTKLYDLDIRISGGMAVSCEVRDAVHLDIWLLHKRDSDGKFPPLGYYSGHPNYIEDMEQSALRFLWERRHLLPKRRAKEDQAE